MSARPAEFLPAEAAAVFNALGDPNRLSLLSRLSGGQPRSITELAENLPLTRQGVTKHLRVLERARLVSSNRIGRETRFTLDPLGLADARDFLERASRQWDAAAARLKVFVEDRGAAGE
jgi:DNA-binding transcriptional ArsR family regulator